MKIQKIVLMLLLQIERILLIGFKIKKNRISFISLETSNLTSDFKCIYDQLDDSYDIQLCLMHFQKNIFGQFRYMSNCLKQYYLIHTSRIVFLHDNNYVVSNFKRKGVVVIQVWHACGAIKKFGNVINRAYKIANYDYVLATSFYWKQPYSEAFSVEEDCVLPLGMPRCDELFDENEIKKNKKYLLNKYPKLKDKKIILYAPTFRGDIYKGFTNVMFDAKKILDKCDVNVYLLYKFHPLINNVKLKEDERVFNMNHEDLHALFSISDVLISDYSSIVFDFIILRKKIIFYVPDLEEYINDIGLFVDIYDFKCPVCKNEEEIIDALSNWSFDELNMIRLKNIFFDIQDEKCVSRILNLINQLMSCDLS